MKKNKLIKTLVFAFALVLLATMSSYANNYANRHLLVDEFGDAYEPSLKSLYPEPEELDTLRTMGAKHVFGRYIVIAYLRREILGFKDIKQLIQEKIGDAVEGGNRERLAVLSQHLINVEYSLDIRRSQLAEMERVQSEEEEEEEEEDDRASPPHFPHHNNTPCPVQRYAGGCIVL